MKSELQSLLREAEGGIYLGLLVGCIGGVGIGAYAHHLLTLSLALGGLFISGGFLASWLHTTRWTGRPVILITTEAAQAIQSGKYAVTSPERLH